MNAEIIKIKDLKITKVQPDRSFIPFPIWESEYYKALKKESEQIYNDYIDLLIKYHYGSEDKTKTEEMSFDNFLDLLADILLGGFKFKEPYINLSENNEVLDGQHRIVILYYIDPEGEILVNEERNVIGDWKGWASLKK